METRVYSDLALHGALVMSKNESGFPANPVIGTMIIKDQCLYAYITIGGMETWYPFANRTNSYIHTQGVPSLTWTVNHQLGTTDIWYQVKDQSGNVVLVGKTDINEDSFQLDFTEAIVGTCIVVAPDSINVPTIKAISLDVANGAVVIDSSGVLINGSYALTSAIIDSEITRATNAEATLTANLNAEITRATNAEATLQSSISTEITNRTNADTTLAINLNTEITRAINADATLSANLDAEITRAKAAEASVQSGINAEITRATNAESTLTANLNTEITRATNAESTLTANLNTEITRATNAENTLTANLNTEITRATNAESTLTANLNTEITRATNAESTITANLNTEITRATNAESTLTANLNTEITRATNAEATLQSSISTEVTNRTNADATLTANLNAEITRAKAAESSLSSAISSLGNVFEYVGTVEGGASSGAAYNLSSLTQKSTGDYYRVLTSGWFVVGAGTPFYANIQDGLIWNASGSVDIIDNTNATTTGTASEISVAGSIDTGYTVSIDSAFKTRMSNVESGLLTETTRATNAEATLTANLNAEITRAMAAESSLQSSVSGLTSVVSLPYGKIDSTTLTTSTTTADQVFATYSATSYRTIKALVQVTSGTSYQCSEILVIHNGTTADISEYALMTTGSTLATYSADISGGNVRLLVTPVNAVSTIKTVIILTVV